MGGAVNLSFIDLAQRLPDSSWTVSSWTATLTLTVTVTVTLTLTLAVTQSRN